MTVANPLGISSRGIINPESKNINNIKNVVTKIEIWIELNMYANSTPIKINTKSACIITINNGPIFDITGIPKNLSKINNKNESWNKIIKKLVMNNAKINVLCFTGEIKFLKYALELISRDTITFDNNNPINRIIKTTIVGASWCIR